MQQNGECVFSSRRSQNEREILLTKTSIGIVVGIAKSNWEKVLSGFLSVFILCHLVKWIPNIYELVITVDDKVTRLLHISVRKYQIYLLPPMTRSNIIKSKSLESEIKVHRLNINWTTPDPTLSIIEIFCNKKVSQILLSMSGSDGMAELVTLHHLFEASRQSRKKLKNQIV